MERIAVGIVSKLRLTANALTPINQLPPEILCEVFFHLRPVIRRGAKQPRSTRQPFEGLLAVTHTCQHWRETAIAAPDLWSQLVARDPRKDLDNMTLLFISRSGDLLLDADLGYRLDAVAPYANRLRTLSCKGCTADDFSRFSNHPAPFLETLHIHTHYADPEGRSLPTLFNNDSPSLRELVVSGYNPFTNNHFKGLSSLSLNLSSQRDSRKFLTPLLAMLHDCPRLEELFLSLGVASDNLPSADGIPTRVPLHALRKLHLRATPAGLTYRFLDSVDLALNGIAVQFTNITPEPGWVFPTMLPRELSLQSVTSLEIIYTSGRGLIIQGVNPGMQIRVVEDSTSNMNHEDRLRYLVHRTSPQPPLRELWIHIERKKEYKLPPLSQLSNLEKLVVRVTTNGNPIRRLLRMLDVDGGVPCPLLSMLDLSGVLSIEHLSKVLKARSSAGCRLGRLRLGSTLVLPEDITILLDHVEELELFKEDAEPRGMEFPAVCTTETSEWWEPWTNHNVGWL